MNQQSAVWQAFEFSAELHMLRDSINDSRYSGPIPVNCWLAGLRFEIKWYREISQTVVEVWTVEGKLLQQYRINYNGVKGRSALTGTKIKHPLEPELPSKPKVDWWSEGKDKNIFHSHPLISGNLSNLAFHRMILTVLPWLE